jgi:hypothetical protein
MLLNFKIDIQCYIKPIYIFNAFKNLFKNKRFCSMYPSIFDFHGYGKYDIYRSLSSGLSAAALGVCLRYDVPQMSPADAKVARTWLHIIPRELRHDITRSPS